MIPSKMLMSKSFALRLEAAAAAVETEETATGASPPPLVFAFFLCFLREHTIGPSRTTQFRAELNKGDAPKVTEPNLRFPAVFCENLRFSAKICGFLRFPAPSKCLNFQEKGESAKICGFLRKSAFWALSVTLVPSP